MRNKLSLLAIVSVFGLASFSQAQNSVLIGVGYFRPTNGFIRDMFGSQWKLDPDFGSLGVSSDWRFKPSVTIVSAHKNGNRFTAVPVLLTVEKSFGADEASFAPYVKIGAGPSYFDYNFDSAGVHYSQKRISFGGELEAGVVFNNKFRLSARYNGFAKVDSFDFSGLTFSAQYAVFSF